MTIERDDPFGHHAVTGPGFSIDTWGLSPLLIRHKGREWLFDFSDMFGPLLLRRSDGMDAKRQPTSENDPFWRPFNAWLRGGKKYRAVRTKRGKLRFYLCHVPPLGEVLE